MRAGLRGVVACLALAFWPGCAGEQRRLDRAGTRLQSASGEFYASHRRYPRSLAELQASAGTQPLDLRPFASVDLKPDKHGGLSIWAVPKKSGADELGIILRVSRPGTTHCGSLGPAAPPADK